MIAIVDYGAGNISSVRKALEHLGADAQVTSDPDVIAAAQKIIVPGVGHFSRCQSLNQHLRAPVLDAIKSGKPFLGICVGMQWLFAGSTEAPETPGAALFAGECSRFPATVKSPHVGWSQIEVSNGSRLLQGVSSGAFVYYTHSYRAPVVAETVACTNYGGAFSAVVERDNVFGVQFHPEKSATAGLKILRTSVPSEPLHPSKPNPGLHPDKQEPSLSGAPGLPGTPWLAKRIIACLDVDGGRVVKGIQFQQLRDAGDPAELALAHASAGADEIVLLDITATSDGRKTLVETVRRTARELFVPFTVGGGIRTLEDAARVFDAGADKVTVNSAAVARPDLVGEIAARFGSQAVIVAIDARRGTSPADAAEVYVAGGRTATGKKALAWAREAEQRGAGEILLTSMDRDGTGTGFDCELTAAIAGTVSIPVIASGGAGTAEHFVDVFTTGKADAALAASIFHFSTPNFGANAVAELKQSLVRQGISMRWPC